MSNGVFRLDKVPLGTPLFPFRATGAKRWVLNTHNDLDKMLVSAFAQREEMAPMFHGDVCTNGWGGDYYIVFAEPWRADFSIHKVPGER